MNTGTSLMNKVVIALLVLILAALGVVIYQNSRKPDVSPKLETAQVAAETTEAAPEAVVEQPVEPAPPAPVARPKAPVVNRPTIVRRVAAVAPAAEPLTSEANPPAEDPVLAAVPVPVPVPGAPVGGGGIAKSEGSITGRILFSGTRPAEIPIQMDATCGRLQPQPMTTRHYIVNSEGALANVFVYIKTGLEQMRFAKSVDQPLMDNVNCMFEPYVMGVQTGQTFRVRNSDSLLHNFHLTPKINRERNSALPIKGQVLSAKLDQPEILVRMKCDVHPWMFAYIGAVAHPFFSVTDTNGMFSLPAGLPDGTYTLAAYHLKAGEKTKEITVKSGEVQRVDFEFTTPAPKVELGTTP